MSEIAIRVERLGKQYRLGQKRARYSTLRDQIGEWTAPRNWFRHSAVQADTTQFWALRGVSFEVKRGDVVGIIGRNGAGKSTLLKILSRITEPTEGAADIDGRVGSLLEVGTGFHPELTGRENTFLNGAILGMKREEILRKFDEIVAFAEVEKFIDTPVKHYSSGMYMRLAFAVAAHLDPEILIVDEVLAVGDAEFQKKCLGKMNDVARCGRTVLFVSHNIAAIQSLCQFAIRLHRGNIVGSGPTAGVVRDYLREKENIGTQSREPRKLTDEFDLHEFGLQPNALVSGSDARLRVRLKAHVDSVLDGLCALIYSTSETRVAVVDFRLATGPIKLRAGQSLVVDTLIEAINLVEGDYTLGLHLHSRTNITDFLELATFEVSPAPTLAGVLPYPPASRGLVELRTKVPQLTIE